MGIRRVFQNVCISTARQTWQVMRCRKLSIEAAGEEIKMTLMKYQAGSVVLTKDEDSGLAMIKLSHPERRNALSGSMMCELGEIVHDLQSWTTGKGLLMYGEAHTFCSGGDLTLMNGILDPEQGKRMSQFMHGVMVRFRSLPLFSVALLEGRALGGGAELALTCDFRLMTPSAKIGFVQSRLGIIPGWGGGHRLVDIVGAETALDLLSTGVQLSAEQAKNRSLVTKELESDDGAMEEATEWLKQRTVAPHATIHAIKQLVQNSTSEASLQAALVRENELFGQVWGAPDHIHALGLGLKHK